MVDAPPMQVLYTNSSSFSLFTTPDGHTTDNTQKS